MKLSDDVWKFGGQTFLGVSNASVMKYKFFL